MATLDLRVYGISILFGLPEPGDHYPSITVGATASDPVEELVIDWGDGAFGQPQTFTLDPAATLLGPFSWNYEQTRSGTLAITATAFAGGVEIAHDSIRLSTWLNEEAGVKRTGTDGQDVIIGSLHGDTLRGAADDDTLYGFEGNDSLLGGIGHNVLDGGRGEDTLSGGPEGSSLNGGEGNDLLHGGLGADTLNGHAGADVLRAGASDDVLWGGAAADEAEGGGGDDTLIGGLPDTLSADVDGLGGGDTLRGQTGDDLLIGGEGNDHLIGGGNNDTLEGGAHPDRLSGGAGEDVFIGGSENDRLISQLDGVKDTFVFGLEGDAGVDRILNFELGIDKIRLPTVAPGTHLEFSGAATMAGPTILVWVDSTRLGLGFDPDGSGAGFGFAIAELMGVTTISLSDFELLG
jgi:Ca2+-binding RTX toxin-like protein